MKRLNQISGFLIIVGLAIIFSCSKENYNNRIVGEWLLQERYGDSPNDIRCYKYVFDDQGSYKEFYRIGDNFDCETMEDSSSGSTEPEETGTYKIISKWGKKYLERTYWSPGGWFSSPGYRTVEIKIKKLKENRLVLNAPDKDLEYEKCK